MARDRDKEKNPFSEFFATRRRLRRQRVRSLLSLRRSRLEAHQEVLRERTRGIERVRDLFDELDAEDKRDGDESTESDDDRRDAGEDPRPSGRQRSS